MGKVSVGRSLHRTCSLAEWVAMTHAEHPARREYADLLSKLEEQDKQIRGLKARVADLPKARTKE